MLSILCVQPQKMPTICETCFPKQSFTKTMIDQNRLDSFFSDMTKKAKMFWIGYVVCDPKIFDTREDLYDLHVDEIIQMNLDNLPVIYNHAKHRKPLGHIILSWHDHDFPNSSFAIAFLATITNRTILQSPAAVTLFGDTCPSLSTLRSQRNVTAEVSVTFCGARKGCLGMFVTGDRVKEKCSLFGLLGKEYIDATLQSENFAENYKQMRHNIHASFQNMSQQPTSDVCDVLPEQKSIEDILMHLPSEDYQQILSHMKSNKDALHIASQKTEDLNEAVGLLSDFMCSMIKTRMALEENNDSELAQKRRNDFMLLKQRGVFEKSTTDAEAIQEMLAFCRECFNEETTSHGVSRVCEIFQKHFPHLSNRLPESQRTTNDTLSTIDAAFGVLNDEMKRKEMKMLLRDQEKAKKNLADVASAQYKGLQKFTKQSISKDSNGTCDSKMNGRSRNAGLDIFLEQCGLSSKNESSPTTSPVAKKRKMNDNIILNDSREDDENEFLKFALEKETERKNATKRYQQYRDDFKKQKEMKTVERQKQIEKVIEALPKINNFIESYEDIIAMKDIAGKLPELLNKLPRADTPPTNQVTGDSQCVQEVQKHSNPQSGGQGNETATIDASIPLLTKTQNGEQKTCLFEL